MLKVLYPLTVEEFRRPIAYCDQFIPTPSAGSNCSAERSSCRLFRRVRMFIKHEDIEAYHQDTARSAADSTRQQLDKAGQAYVHLVSVGRSARPSPPMRSNRIAATSSPRYAIHVLLLPRRFVWLAKSVAVWRTVCMHHHALPRNYINSSSSLVGDDPGSLSGPNRCCSTLRARTVSFSRPARNL